MLLGAIASVALAASVTVSNGVFSPNAAQRLNATIADIVRKHKLPSAAVGVWIPGKGQYTYLIGEANLRTRAARRFEQPFRIASITKTFVATAVLQLVDRGRLRKSDPIAKWYPWFPNASIITIDDLLRMRSGIPAPSDEEALAVVYDDPTAAGPSLEQSMGTVARKRREFVPPNRVGIYNELNYDILGGIVERTTGKDLRVVITESVIKPLGLSGTAYPTANALPGGLHGYGWDPRTRRFEDKTVFNPELAGAAGAMISTMLDLRTYARALCRGTLLKPATQHARLEGKPLKGSEARYGEGVAFGHGFCGHSGTIPGFNTDMYYVPKFDASVVISVNRLDKDNVARSAPVFAAVTKALIAALGRP
jgi:D-alanyl-D-alanine carboxypeptidase